VLNIIAPAVITEGHYLQPVTGRTLYRRSQPSEPNAPANFPTNLLSTY